MAHPQMFDDDDPVLARVREIALALPGASEKVSHGRPVFFTRKIFACYGASVKGDDGWEQYPESLLVLPDPAELSALRGDDRFFVPAYYGPSGWIGLHLGDDVDWGEVAELVDESFRNTAGKRLIAELDARTG